MYSGVTLVTLGFLWGNSEYILGSLRCCPFVTRFCKGFTLEVIMDHWAGGRDLGSYWGLFVRLWEHLGCPFGAFSEYLRVTLLIGKFSV